MRTVIKNIKDNIHDSIMSRFNKISILLFLMVFFSLLYMLLDDTHFEGVNKFKEIVKEEVIKDKVKKEMKENYANLEESSDININIDKDLEKYYSKNKVIEEKVIDDVAKETEKEVKEEELAPAKVDPSLLDKYFNRLYFAVITGCLLGYGDIYPVTNVSKFISGLQGLMTVGLIVY
jgi:hypothetical protein